MNPSDYRDNQRRFIADAERKLKQKFAAEQKTAAFVHKIEEVVAHVIALARPIQQAGGAVKPDDLASLKEHVLTWTMESLHNLDRETVTLIAGTHLAQRVLDEIENDPWGKGTPEGLSGQ